MSTFAADVPTETKRFFPGDASYMSSGMIASSNPGSAAAANACTAKSNLEFIGSYVTADTYARGPPNENPKFVASSCADNVSLSAYASDGAKTGVFPYGNVDLLPGAHSGLSSRSLDIMGGKIPYGPQAQAFNAKARSDPFAGVVIPRVPDAVSLQGVLDSGYQSYLTTNWNQTRDLRGDIPVPVTTVPTGASVSVHGAFAEVYPYRGYVY
jgi:hypothetical protein